MNNNITVGAYVKRWLKYAGKTQSELADYLGIKQGSLSMILNGKASFPRERLRDIISYLNPPAEDATDAIKLFFWAGIESSPAAQKTISAVTGLMDQVRGQMDVFLQKNLAAIQELELDMSDSPTYMLLEYWRGFDQATRFELLSKAAELHQRQ